MKTPIPGLTKQVEQAETLAQQLDELSLHSDAQKRQLTGKVRHFASRGDVLVSSFAAGCVKGALPKQQTNWMSFVPMILRFWL